MNPVWLVLPMRSFDDGKRRLAAVLDDEQRHALNRALFVHALEQAALWPGLRRTLVVSPSPAVLETARAQGAQVLLQEPLPHIPAGHADTAAAGTAEPGLNAAVAQAWRALQSPVPVPVLVASCDLPWCRADDLRALADHAAAGASCRVVIAVDRAGSGTNALFVPAGVDMQFGYGPDSARRHHTLARSAGCEATLLQRPGLAFDIDSPADWQAWRRAEVCA